MFTEINPAPNRERQTVQVPCQSHRPKSMPAGAHLKFRNDRGVREIGIGVRKFKCIGESSPQDHPHIYINMGEGDTILCPYCGTGFRFDPRLTPLDAEPPVYSLTRTRPDRSLSESRSTGKLICTLLPRQVPMR
jgi:uncharacterized Zn-finger protein